LNCHNCDTRVLENSNFCLACGVAVAKEKRCDSCEEFSPNDSNFCVSCGNSFGGLDNDQNVIDVDSILVRKVSSNGLENLAETMLTVPYGFYAVLFKNGKALQVIEEGATIERDHSSLALLIAEIKKSISKFFGKETANAEIYLISDLGLLPLAKYTDTYAVPGKGDVSVNFKFVFGRDLEALSRSFEAFFAGRDNLSLKDFLTSSIERLNVIMSASTTAPVGSQEWGKNLENTLRQVCGLELIMQTDILSAGLRYTTDFGVSDDTVTCRDCRETSERLTKFCEFCGSTNLTLKNQSSMLFDSEGQAVVAKLSYRHLDEASTELNNNIISNFLKTMFARYDYSELRLAQTIRTVEGALNDEVAVASKYMISDLRIIDIRTEGAEWEQNTQSLIDREMRNADFVRQRMVLSGDAEQEYLDAIFELSLRKRTSEISQHSKDLDLNLQKSRIESKFTAEKIILDSEMKRAEHGARLGAMDLDGEISKKADNLIQSERQRQQQNELDDIAHSANSQREAVKSDIDVEQMKAEAQASRESIQLQSEANRQKMGIGLEFEQQRQKADLEQAKLQNENDLELSKLSKMADIERAMADQDSQSEINRIAALRGLSSQEIIAMQAVELAKQSNPDNVADLVENMVGNKSQTEMYKELLEEKQRSKEELATVYEKNNDVLVKANASMGESISKSGDSRLDGYKLAAESAKSTNEKSMDSMAKVATGAAQRKEQTAIKLIPCLNRECTYKFETKAGKFCPICGTVQ
jgi:hypothetical protein